MRSVSAKNWQEVSSTLEVVVVISSQLSFDNFKMKLLNISYLPNYSHLQTRHTIACNNRSHKQKYRQRYNTIIKNTTSCALPIQLAGEVWPCRSFQVISRGRPRLRCRMKPSRRRPHQPPPTRQRSRNPEGVPVHRSLPVMTACWCINTTITSPIWSLTLTQLSTRLKVV